MKKTFIVIIMLLISAISYSQKPHEKYYQNIAAERMHGRTEVVLEDRSRADIVTDTFAIEVEFAHKWAESIGQSEFYSLELHKKAGIVLITDGMKDDKYVQRLMKVATKLKITVWVIFTTDNSWGIVDSIPKKDGEHMKYIY
jgi:hypothetical protein